MVETKSEQFDRTNNIESNGYSFSYEELIQNSKYEGFFNRNQERSLWFENEYERICDEYEQKPKEEKQNINFAEIRNQLRKKINLEKKADSEQTLATEKEDIEYRYYNKFKTVEYLMENHRIDLAMIDIAKRLAYFPLTIIETCSQHIDKGSSKAVIYEHTDGLPTYCSSTIFMNLDKENSPKENDLVKKFLINIDKVNDSIAKRMKIPKSNFFTFRIDLEDEDWQTTNAKERLSPGSFGEILENFDKIEVISLYLDYQNKDLANNRSKEFLTVAWEEFYRYLNTIDGINLPIPDFGKEGIFDERSPKTNSRRIN